MLTRLRRLLTRPAPRSLVRVDPVVDTVACVPSPAKPRDPDPDAVSNHYPPLTRKLSPVDREAAPFDGERQPGDEIWAFFSRKEDWQAKGGRAGVALVRDGRIVRSVVTMLN